MCSNLLQLREQLAITIGVRPDDLTDELLSTLIGVGRAAVWSEEYHAAAEALTIKDEREMENTFCW